MESFLVNYCHLHGYERLVWVKSMYGVGTEGNAKKNYWLQHKTQTNSNYKLCITYIELLPTHVLEIITHMLKSR